MALDKVKITTEVINNSLINSGDKIEYKVLQNLSPWVYNTGENAVDKTFIDGSTAPINNFVELDGSNVIDEYGGTNNNINVVHKFTHNGEELIAIGGDFTTYTPIGGNQITAIGFIIIDVEGNIIQANNNIFLKTIVVINDIKYHEANKTLIIGGNFNGLAGETPLNDLNHLFEYDIDQKKPTDAMINWGTNGSIDRGGSINTIAIRQSLGQIYFGGSFSSVFGNMTENIGKVDADFLENQSSILNFNTNVADFLKGVVNTLYINQTGTPRLLVGGSFNWDDNDNTVYNLMNLNSFGVHIPSEFTGSNADGEVFYINEFLFSAIFIVGNFSNYQGLTNKSAVAVENSGSILPAYDFPTPQGYLSTGGYTDTTEIDAAWVILKETSTGINKVVRLSNFTAEVEYEVIFDTDVYTIAGELNNKVYVGGNFSTTEIDVNNLPENYIQIGTTEQETAQNIYNNYSTYNLLINDPAFSISLDNNKIVVEKIIQDSNTIYDIANIVDRDYIYEVSFESDAPSLNSSTSLLPLRTDFIELVENNDGFNRTEFNIFQPSQNILNTGDTLKIIKNKLSDEELNRYINLSRIISSENIGIKLQDYLDMPRNTNVVNSNQGGFVQVKINSLFNNNVLSEIQKNYFALEGYQFDKGRIEDKILINGDKRLIDKNGTLTLPFFSRQINSITIIEDSGSSQVITQNNFNLENLINAGEFISYLTLNMANYNNNITISFVADPAFINTGNTDKDIRVIKDNTCSLYDNTRVIFKNSYGILEEIYLKGNLIENIDIKGEEYKKSIYSNIDKKDKYLHLTTDFNKTSTREYTLNTNNTYSFMNPVFEDMVNSEYIWLDNPKIGVVAVNITDSNFDKQKEVSDGVINYTFDFKESKNLTEKFNFI